ncbi:hypothetical protein ACIHFD_35970 [Nonomuraea sp. NPDC051941]|uniref:hypothetical protein n=1 Tax=Nonomuraea sp. NPDC051941 TaxID=3364373 RepID=UPI0037C5B6A6
MSFDVCGKAYGPAPGDEWRNVESQNGCRESNRFGGLGDFYRLDAGADFGRLEIRREDQVRPQKAVDYLGEPIDDRPWLRIGDADEQALLMDTAPVRS